MKVDPARVPHYASAADMVANYRAIHGAFWRQPAPPAPAVAAPVPVAVVPDPEPPEPELDPEEARMLMVAETYRRPPLQRSLFDLIAAAVCREFHIEKQDLFLRSRVARIVTPRYVLFVLARHLTPMSLPQIGRRLGGFDHTTVLHGINKFRHVFEAVKDDVPPHAPPAEWVRVMRLRLEI